MSFKFEIFTGAPQEIVKRLEGQDRLQIASTYMYEGPTGTQLAVITKEDSEGFYPWPFKYEYKEWTLDEWAEAEENGTYYGWVNYDEEGNVIYGGDYVTQKTGWPFWDQTPRGVKGFTFDQRFFLPMGWSRPTVTLTEYLGGPFTVAGLDNWPDDLEFNLGITNGNASWTLTGTKDFFLGTTFEQQGAATMFSAAIDFPGGQVYMETAFNDPDAVYPLVLNTDSAGVQFLPQWYAPNSGGAT